MLGLAVLTVDLGFFNFFKPSPLSSLALNNLIEGQQVYGFDFSVNVTEEPKRGIGTREYFGKIVKEVVPLNELVGRIHDCESRNLSTIGINKPDYLLRCDQRGGEQSIVVVGEVKGIANCEMDFPDKDVGQILDFIKEVLLKQGWRQYVYGFLTDCIRFEFFCGKRSIEDNGFRFTRSSLLIKGAGWSHLSQLLQQSDEILGFKKINVEGWELKEWLGAGASSSVFAVNSVDGSITSAVCKIYTNERDVAEILRSNEHRALSLMQTDLFTPKIISDVKLTSGSSEALPVLVVSPRSEKLGYNGVRLPISAYANLVSTLRRCHELKLCHNDVCPDNMFAVLQMSNNKNEYYVILNDWGTSMTWNEMQTSYKVATRLQYYDQEMGPGQDVAALVRSVFSLTMLTFDPVSQAKELDDIMRSQKWGDVLDAALNCQYDNVTQFLLSH